MYSKFGNSSTSMREVSYLQFYKNLTRKTTFLRGGLVCFKFNNLRLAPGANLKFYTSVAKDLKLKFKKFWGLIPTFLEVTGEKLVWGQWLSLLIM